VIASINLTRLQQDLALLVVEDGRVDSLDLTDPKNSKSVGVLRDILVELKKSDPRFSRVDVSPVQRYFVADARNGSVQAGAQERVHAEAGTTRSAEPPASVGRGPAVVRSNAPPDGIPNLDDEALGAVLSSDRPAEEEFEIAGGTGLDKQGRPDTTDMGNAVRLARRYGDRLRYTEALGWLYWNGKCWVPGVDRAKRAGMETAASIHEEAGSVLGNDPARYAALTKWAAASQASPKVAAMIDWARWLKPIFAEPKDFDRDPYLFNVNNGTIDLRSGLLRPHDSADMITKLSSVKYVPEATSDLWDDYFKKALAGKDGLEAFIQRLCGYTMVAERREDIFLIPHGDGGGGKTTLVNGMTAVFGDYAGKLAAKGITQQGAAGHSDELASLNGKRFVVIGETEKIDSLRTGLMKTASGGEPYIPVSHKGMRGFNMAVSFQFWMPTNEVPNIDAADTGAWRRIFKLPFTNIFSPAIKGRREEMARGKHAEAFLAWCVRGCMEWQRIGLNPPACVIEATKQLRESMDKLDGFFEDFGIVFTTIPGPHDFEETRVIMAAYKEWAFDHDVPERWQVGPEKMAAALKVRGATKGLKYKSSGPRGWVGVKITRQLQKQDEQGRWVPMDDQAPATAADTLSRVPAPAKAPARKRSARHAPKTAPNELVPWLHETSVVAK
jgi:P4 family phage/plasmid primase-like protien